MIPGPLVPDLSSPTGPPGSEGARRSGRFLVPIGIALIATSVVAIAVWAIFLSPFGFKRYPLVDQDRTFTIHQAGTYVLYLEGDGESAPALPPAIEVSAAGLTGQHLDIRMLGTPGVVAAPDAYDVWDREGRGLAVVHADRAGTFVVHVQPAPADQVDPRAERVVTDGTIAIGRGSSRSWLAGWAGLALLSGVPLLAGVGLVIVGWRVRAVR